MWLGEEGNDQHQCASHLCTNSNKGTKKYHEREETSHLPKQTLNQKKVSKEDVKTMVYKHLEELNLWYETPQNLISQQVA